MIAFEVVGMSIAGAYRLLSSIWSHPANRGQRVNAIRKAILWQVSSRLSHTPQDIAYHGLKLRCYPKSHSATRAIYFAGLPDFWEMRFIQDYLRSEDRFIDVGANVGLYSLLARSVVGPTGRVDAFEPGAAVLPKLEESLRLNHLDNVVVHRVGLGETAGSVVFDSTGDDCTAHVAPGAVATEVDSPNAIRPNAIRIVRLDEYLPDVPYGMAKFDIEGYEPFAIRGASRFLAQGNPPVMLVEMAGYTKRHGMTTPQFIALLHELGYSTCVYRPQERRLEKTNEPWTIPVDNVLAVHRRREQEVIDRISSAAK